MNKEQKTSGKKVEVYSTPTCVYCNLAKEYMKAHGVKYAEYNVGTDLAKRKEMVEKTGQLGVPVIVVDGEAMVGFDEEALAGMLGIK
ncbi:MAG: glutaredoxin domain-containing protein [bacterium]